jgi:hypothetical protein
MEEDLAPGGWMDLRPQPGELPPGYPEEHQQEEVLRDGRRVFIRPILRGVHTFTASYQAENRPVAALVEDAGGLSTQVIEHGIADFSLAIDRRQPPTDAGGPPPAR